ncbi:MAG: alkaline phosphatase D family protein [Rhodospirillales bacterium]
MSSFRPSRRGLLRGAAGTSLLLAGGLALPAVSRAAERPQISHGLQSGDVTTDSAVIWARADRPADLLVEVATSDSFENAKRLPPVHALPARGQSAKLLLEGLPADQEIFYRVTPRSLDDVNLLGKPSVGRLRTAPQANRKVAFVWGGDVAGQGWGIDESRGGMKIFARMAGHDPDFFLHSGDTIYADNPLQEKVELAEGGTWTNLMTPEKAKVAETLEEFRGNYLYNLLDPSLRAFNAQVPVFVQWDDHEVVNNWYPGEILEDERYRERSVNRLVARAAQAFHEMYPILPQPQEPFRVYRKIAYGPLVDVFVLDKRSYRAANSANRQAEAGPETAFLGPEQLAWLKRELVTSKALWKVIQSDMPVGLVVADGRGTPQHFENGANGDGPALGRELELAELLRFIKAAGVDNTVWLTADVHYTAAHYYDPNKAQFQDFEPFWEFVTGPLHAGTFGPNALDNTFGPEVRFVKAPSEAQGRNLPPSDGLQFFGQVEIEPTTGVMTVTLRDIEDQALWSVDLEPKRA